VSISARDEILRTLAAQAANAARRNKPTMWAYYERMRELIERELDADSDGGVAGQALALSQRAEEQCARLPPTEAADLWALGIYCRRILKAWRPGHTYRVSLKWLRARAGVGEAANVAKKLDVAPESESIERLKGKGSA
jgi:hypothetical protein